MQIKGMQETIWSTLWIFVNMTRSNKWDSEEKKRSVREPNVYTYDVADRTRRILINLSFVGVAGLFFYLLLVI